MRRSTVFWILLFFGCVDLSVPRDIEAETVAQIAAQARQAAGQASAIKRRGWSRTEQQQIIETVGPLALKFLNASDLAQAAGRSGQRAQVRSAYNSLSRPLEDIYDYNSSRLERMTKDVMDQDGDLEAVYETQAWKDAQALGSQSLYFLNWMHYVGATVYDGAKRKKLLKKAMEGFSEFAVVQKNVRLRHESLFGRALCEKELEKFDWAIRDFELLLKEKGLSQAMERKVRLGLVETYALSGKIHKAVTAAEQLSARGVASPSDRARIKYLRAYALFKAIPDEKGAVRERHRKEAIALVEDLRREGGYWKRQAEALGKTGVTKPRDWATTMMEEESSFLLWEQVKEHLQKSQYATAVPLLRKVVTSSDPGAAEYKRAAHYFLGVGLFQQKQYQESAEQLGAFLNADGRPPQFGPEAAYLRFKAAEALYARDASTDRLYVDATKDFIRRYPGHGNIFEAHFRLGEYYHSKKDYLQAVESYRKVRGQQAFEVRANYAMLQCYFTLLNSIDGKRDGKPKNIGISEVDLRKRIGTTLDSFWKDYEELRRRSPSLAKRAPYDEYPGKASVMHAVFLSKDVNGNAPQIATLLDNFERKYPEQKDAFSTVARMRLVALQKADRFGDLEKEVHSVFTRFKKSEEQQELLTGLIDVLPKDVRKLEKKNDKENLLAAKRTLVRLREDRLERGVAFAEDESPERFKYELAQLYLDVKAYDKAVPIYKELRQGAYSLAALAGLAQIADVQGNNRQAFAYWEQMLKETQVGDPLWFRGTYEVADIHAKRGKKDLACRTVSSTRSMLSRVGDPGLKQKIQTLAAQSCQ